MSSVHLFSHIAIEHKKTFSLSTARTQSALCIHAWTETSSALCSIRFALVGCRHVFAQKYHDLEFVYNRSCRFFSASLIKFYSTRLTRQAKVTMMDMKDSDELESKIICSLALCTVTRSFFLLGDVIARYISDTIKVNLISEKKGTFLKHTEYEVWILYF